MHIWACAVPSSPSTVRVICSTLALSIRFPFCRPLRCQYGCTFTGSAFLASFVALSSDEVWALAHAEGSWLRLVAESVRWLGEQVDGGRRFPSWTQAWDSWKVAIKQRGSFFGSSNLQESLPKGQRASCQSGSSLGVFWSRPCCVWVPLSQTSIQTLVWAALLAGPVRRPLAAGRPGRRMPSRSTGSGGPRGSWCKNHSARRG